MVALSKDGKTEASLDNLVLIVFGIDDNTITLSSKEVIEAIEVYFNLSLNEQFVQSSIDRLVESGKLQNQDSSYVVHPKTLSEVRARISETNRIEEAVRNEWLASFKNYAQPILPEWYEPLWKCLKIYMAKAFHRHGIETTLLLNPNLEITNEDRKQLSTYLQEAISEACEQIPSDVAIDVVVSFFTTSTDLRTKYVAQLLDATFTYFALTIDRTVSKYLSSQIPNLSLFLDTNFIFGLLDLSSSPLSNVTKELIGIIKAHRLPFRLYYHEKTLEEFSNAIESAGYRLKGRSWSQSLSRAAVRSHQFSGIELRYHEKNALSPLSPDIFISKYEHATELLNGLGLTIYRSSGVNKDLDRQRHEMVAQYDEYIKQNRRRGSKAYEVLNHDMILWQTVEQLRVNGSSVLDARAFMLSIDYYLYSFDWQNLRHKTHVGKVLLPNHFLQILRPFLPNNDDFNKHFVETFAIPEFRATETDYAATTFNILSYLNTYREVEENSALRMLTNTLLRDRLRNVEGDSQEFKELVDNALIEENTQLAQENVSLAEQVEATKQIVEQNEAILSQKDQNLVELEEKYQKVIELNKRKASEVVELASKLEVEEDKARSREIELEIAQKGRHRYESFFRATLGFVIASLGFVGIYFLAPQFPWFNQHPHRNGLYLATSLIVVGLVWAIVDNNRNRRAIALGTIVLGVILELIQIV